MASLILLMTTFADEQTAAIAVRHLVQERLVVCGTLIPNARSIYAWQGSIQEDQEVVVWIKTNLACSERCQQRLKELHPYEIPEIITFESTAVGDSYFQWMQGVLKKSGT